MPYRIDLGAYDPVYEGEWVDIKEKRSFADVKRVEAKGARGHQNDAGEVEFTMDVLEQSIAKLETSVINWSLKTDAGAPLPPHRGGFVSDDFDAELGDWLIDQIDAYYRERSRSKRGAPAAGAEAEVSAS